MSDEISLSDLAALLGRTVQGIRPLAKRGMPTNSAEAARAWIEANVGESGPPTLGERESGEREAPRNLTDKEKIARTRRHNALAKKQERENAIAEGRLTETETVVREFAGCINIIRARIEAIPERLRAEIPADLRGQLIPLLEDSVRMILTEMSVNRMESLSGQTIDDLLIRAGDAARARRAAGNGDRSQE